MGAALGETLGCDGFKQSQQATGWGSITVITAQSLIKCGCLDLKALHSSLPLSSSPPLAIPSLGAIMATLPVALFYHDNEIKLRQNLLSVVDIWQHDPASRDGALAVGYAVLQSLKEINPAALIPQTIDFLGSPSKLGQHLAQVQTLLEQGAGLERAVTHLARDSQPSTPIALAFYCFLSTLEDFRLSILRATRTGYKLQVTAITGALSGAYNSTAGIPVTLRMALSQPDNKPMAAWGMKTEAEMLELSDYLLAVWSGVYDKTTYTDGVMPYSAIAAPGVIRQQ